MSFSSSFLSLIKSFFTRWDAPADNGYAPQRLFVPQTLVEKFRAMTPYDFEYLVKEIFEAWWYETVRKPLYKSTRYGKKIPLRDGGIDYICQKNGQKYYIQVKTYKWEKQVSLSTMREFVAALVDIGRTENDKAYIITTTTFTNEAKKYATSHHIVCMDYSTFKTMFDTISNISPENHNRLLWYVNKIDYTKNQKFTQHIKSCPECWAPLVKRYNTYKKSYFLGCQNFSITWCTYTQELAMQTGNSYST